MLETVATPDVASVVTLCVCALVGVVAIAGAWVSMLRCKPVAEETPGELRDRLCGTCTDDTDDEDFDDEFGDANCTHWESLNDANLTALGQAVGTFLLLGYTDVPRRLFTGTVLADWNGRPWRRFLEVVPDLEYAYDDWNNASRAMRRFVKRRRRRAKAVELAEVLVFAGGLATLAVYAARWKGWL